ncbi:MAG: ornithine carbamoyltransferase [Chloroflexi bacterium]|nr:ornithine carbamoyltransferase [Chloroflexota bacterium]
MPSSALHGRSLLTIAGLSAAEIAAILDTARTQKDDPAGPHGRALAGKTVVLVFEKPSLRTRVSFEVAARRLGATSLYLSPAEVGLGTREPAKDVARVLSRYADVIVCRTFGQDILEELDRHASVPVINALSDWEHPCQTLADLLTIREHGGTAGRTLAYVGDGNNVARSLAAGAASEGMHVRLAAPAGYVLDDASLAIARERAAASGGSVRVTADPLAAVSGRGLGDADLPPADIVYTDVWTSMGQEEESRRRNEAFAGFQITTDLLAAAPAVRLMHDLPAHRGEEISDAAFESPASVIFDQAENRLHAQQAALFHIMA